MKDLSLHAFVKAVVLLLNLISNTVEFALRGNLILLYQ